MFYLKYNDGLQTLFNKHACVVALKDVCIDMLMPNETATLYNSNNRKIATVKRIDDSIKLTN